MGSDATQLLMLLYLLMELTIMQLVVQAGELTVKILKGDSQLTCQLKNQIQVLLL